IYGKEILGKQPKIKFRRINSNLNSGSTFYNGINYVPERMAFEADQDLIKLLISPLYGNNPTYGVRELLQNSIDACRERAFLEGDESEYLPRIKLSIDTNEKNPCFEISDNGKGMSLFEIKNYFLKAGASFRKSLSWKKDYTDDDGKALVERTGRFGVGVLAAFLIGKEIHVSTRNKNDDVGYTFKASLDSEQIEVTRLSDTPVGTTITIKMDDNKVKFLLSNLYKWNDWYRLKSPQIIYELIRNKEVTITNQSFNDPVKDEQLDTNWHKIEIDNFGQLHWTYPEGSNGGSYVHDKRPNYITCNGFFIPKEYSINRLGIDKEVVHICPKISIFDNEGKLPLTLDRSSIDGKLPFEDELIKDICKDFIAKLLMTQPKSKVVGNSIFIAKDRFKHSCSGMSYTFYVNKNGFNINYHSVRRKMTKKFKYVKFNILNSSKIEKIEFNKSFDINDYVFFFEKKSFENINSYKESIDPYYYYGTTGGRVTLRNVFYNRVFSGGRTSLRSRFLSDHKLFSSDSVWTTIDYNFTADNIFNIKKISPHDCIHSIIQFPGATLPYFRTDANGTGLNILNNLFEKYFTANILIPYDMEQRKVLFKDAFNDLEPYMRKYEKLV
ncbi:MAG: ATP-binding protein, partial [Bacteroidetes bacterium]|nr:ATP-binding protein [Fibrella sp.]